MLRSLLVLTGILLSNAASAVCAIDRFRPTGTITSQPTFMVVATNDCTSVEARFRPPSIKKTATMGAMAGVGAHWYSITLSPAEWSAVTALNYGSLVWTVIGTSASGVRTDETMTNELDLDADGWTRREGDLLTCDRDASRNPGVLEICDNEVDDDCNGEVDECVVLSRATADAVVDGSIAAEFLGATLAVADVDGDGIADLVSGAPANSGPGDMDSGNVYVSFGPLAGRVVGGDDVTITPDSPRKAIGQSLAAGDADGDGFDDILVGAYNNENSAALLLGPITDDVSTSMAALELSDPRGLEEFPHHAQITPDVDGDGGNEIVVTAPFGVSSDGAVFVVPGDTIGTVDDVEDVATYMFRGPMNRDEYLGISTTDLGDTDGDGTDELAMNGRSVTYVVAGGMRGGSYLVTDVAMATITSEEGVFYGGAENQNLESLDYDHDGYRDLMVGVPDYIRGEVDDGAVHVFLGPLTGSIDFETDGVVSWLGDDLGYLVAAGDCNGDGESDFLLGGEGGAYLSVGPVAGVVESGSLAPLPMGASPDGALLFAPDWSGDGVQEIVVGLPNTGTGGAAYVYYSEQFQ